MKKIILVLMSIILAASLISCDELLTGVGSNRGSGGTENNDTELICGLLPETTNNIGFDGTHICVDWMDFVRIDGVVYDGGFENKTVDEAHIGDKLGEILYQVNSSPASQEELDEANNADYASFLRPVGCEIYSVIDDENAIAVLDGGKYYLYTHRVDNSIDFETFGGEMYGLPGEPKANFGVAINTFDQLCEAYGGEESLPSELKTRYGGDKLQDITLVIVELVSGWGGTEYGISSISKSGDDLLVTAVQLDSSGDGDDAEHYWTFYIEIPKTDDKRVFVQISNADPLKNDPALDRIQPEQMQSYIVYEPGGDYSRYEGRAVLDRYAAQEVALGAVGSIGYNVNVRYDTQTNYWLVTFSRKDSSGIQIVDVVVRAADGRIISTMETFGCN